MKYKIICNGYYKVYENSDIVRNKTGHGTYIGRKLKQIPNNRNYCFVHLFWEDRYGQRKYKRIAVHKLIARCFIGRRPKGKEINHKDGNKQHNHSKNLEYVTHKENLIHASKNGMLKYKKISDDDVKKIRRLYKTGNYTQARLGRKFKVHYSTIHLIVKRKNRKCVA